MIEIVLILRRRKSITKMMVTIMATVHTMAYILQPRSRVREVIPCDDFCHVSSRGTTRGTTRSTRKHGLFSGAALQEVT